MRLVAALGNPGKEFTETRHNAGWRALDRFCTLWPGGEVSWTMDKKRKAAVARVSDDRGDVLLAKPQTFMNLSGEAVGALASFYKISPHDVILVHDDIDILLGTARLSVDSGPAGHHGVESVIAHLGTKKFPRIRIGIKPPPEVPLGPGAAFVVGRFRQEEEALLAPVIDRVAKALVPLLLGRIEETRKTLAGEG